MNKGMFSSKKDDWSTPKNLFHALDCEFQFTLDACASKSNAKCDLYFDKKKDGLKQTWTGNVFMNPPYGRVIGKFMRKAFEASSQEGATVVCLVPARTDTAWWHDYAMKGEIRFLRGRVKFGGGKDRAPFPSAVVIFRKRACHKPPNP